MTHVSPTRPYYDFGKLPGMSVKDNNSRLVDDDKNFVYIKRQVSVDIADEIKHMKVPGFHQQAEMRRFYPEGDIAAHVIGFTNIEDKGIEGVELALDRKSVV